MIFTRRPSKERQIEKLLRQHSRLENQLHFSSDFFIGSMRGPRVRKSLREELEILEAEIEELEGTDDR